MITYQAIATVHIKTVCCISITLLAISYYIPVDVHYRPRHHHFLQSRPFVRRGLVRLLKISDHVQGWAKEWALGCVNPAFWLPPAAGGEFTQPRAHSFVHLCTVHPAY